ncbi:MAG: AAA family ATPase [Candidatus Enterosoma sp.]|nr:AAA family ATPase [Candidatus Enterosoma sp.]
MKKDELLNYQPVLTKLFSSSKKKERLANAYLLYGEENAPLKETALALAKMINCKEDDIFCDKCISCSKYDNLSASDFLLIDGKKEIIKKEQIKRLEDFFSMSALEKNHHPIYIINNVENITAEAINSLLKFLEEGKNEVIALLTTNNREKVLKTILSRCVKVTVNPLPYNIFESSLLNQEITIKDNRIIFDRQLIKTLYPFYSCRETLLSDLSEDESFFKAYELYPYLLSSLAVSIDNFTFFILREIQLNSDNKCYNWLFLLLRNSFVKILYKEIDEDAFSSELSKIKSRGYNIEKALREINRILSLSRINPSITLNFLKVADKLKGD